MGKLDHIPELTGLDTYFAWKHKVTYALGIDDQWCHVTETVDPDDIFGSTSFKPIAVDPLNPTAAETMAIHEWLINDLKAKAIITCWLSVTVQHLISTSHKVTACDTCKILEDHFGHIVMGSQYVVSQHSVLHERLLHMWMIYTDAEAVFQLLWRLPWLGSWLQFKALLTITLSTATPIEPTPAAGNVPVVVTPSAFDICITHISAKAAWMIDKQILSEGGQPGSEYVNAVTSSSSSSKNINSITGLHKHCHNPDDIFYTMVRCNKGDHDHAHCYTKGGGMEGQAPWMKGKKKEKEKETTIATVITPPASTSTTLPLVIAVFASTEAAADSYFTNLSCASIAEIVEDRPNMPPNPDTAVLSCLIAAGFNTILDSGTTMTLICNHSYFWSYSTADIVTVCTANYGSIAMLSIGGARH
ncbi:hypothetical protein F4604DRAFT_1933704 [Suillus subluteus]|nr:hypothetical protein F4604DRAFT_1933704 [Suillus subluteus]